MKKIRIILFLLISFVFVEAYADIKGDLSWYNASQRPNYYEISDVSDYEGLIYLINELSISFASDTIAIVSDMSLVNCVSLNKFDGILIGNKHIISDLSEPLIATIENGGIVDGLIFDSSCKVSYGEDLGMVARICNGLIINCINYGNLTRNNSDYRIGGICGKLSKGKILGCVNYGSVICSTSDIQTVLRAGGICAYADSESVIMGCNNHGDITASASRYSIIGGIVGDLQNSIIENCVNYGNVSSQIIGLASLTSSQFIQYTGGIIGQAQSNSTINMCSNYGEISNNTQYVSGIIASADNTNIYNCGNYGNVTSTNGYFYSGASGICSKYNAITLDNNKFFLNCLNTGTIVSKTSNAIATAAGICIGINHANIGNLLNYGTISASATGLNSYEFKIQQYESDGCNILSEISTIEDANTFVKNYTNEPQLVMWRSNDNGIISLSNIFSYDIEPYQGIAIVNCYSDSIDEYILEYSTDEYKNKISFKNDTTLIGLKPNAKYDYAIYDSNRTKQSMGTFSTLPIDLNLSLDTVGYTSAIISMNITERGVNIDKKGFVYRIATDKDWLNQQIDTLEDIELDSLKDNTEYEIKPYVEYMGIHYEGESYKFKTKELIPLMERTKYTYSSMEFKTSNIEQLVSYKYGITCEDKDFYADENGIIVVDSLTYYKTYTIYAFIEKFDEKVLYDLGEFDLIQFYAGEALQISPLAAEVKVIANAGEVKINLSTYPYSNIYIQYRNINTPDNETSIEVMPIKSDDYHEYRAALIFDKDGIYQYRIKATTTNSSRYSYYREKFSDWKIINTQEHNCDTVIPDFCNIQASIEDGGDVALTCAYVPGELNIATCGIEYKMDFQQYFMDMPFVIEQEHKYYSTSKKYYDQKNGRMSCLFSTLVAGYDYIGRFYSVCDGIKYYSLYFKFNSNGELELLPNYNDGIASTSIVASNDLQISSSPDTIIINGNIFEDIEVYDLYGRLHYCGRKNVINVVGKSFYIIKIGNNIQKIYVK